MRVFGRFEKPGGTPRFSTDGMRARRGVMGVLGGLLLAVACAPTFAQDRPAAGTAPEPVHYGWADVLRVDPVYEDGPAASGDAAAAQPQQECYEEQVLEAPAQGSAPDDGKRVGGTVIGALVGSLIGSRFGKGDGRKAATAAGAVAGGVIGNNVAANSASPPGPPRYRTQRRCRQVEGNGSRHVVAYDVEYRYRGEVYTSRMNADPGDRMRVRVTVMPAE